MNELTIKGIATSFVYHKMKLISDKGSGEGKLFIGAASKAADFDSFFEFGSNYKYKLDKQNLLNYMHEVKLEYVYQFFNKYQEANIANWESYLNVINSFETQDLIINLVKQADSSRYYVDQEKFNENDKLVFKNFIRKIIVPKLTNIVFEKNIETKEITLRLFVNYNFDKQEDISTGSFDVNIKSHNRIIFGAPGTGKSHKLEQETKSFEDNISIKDSEESMVQIEIQESGNNYGKNFAIGLNHSEFFKDQKPKLIREKYNCSNDAAYTIAQGMRAANLKSELPNLADDKLTDDNIKIELDKLLKKKDLKQAGAALIGYMYSDALSGRTVSELADSFDLSKTGSLASWIQLGVQASEYKFDISKDNKSKRYERVTFHPNYSYAQFVGTYKPIQDRGNKDNIRYEYVPGPFMRIYVNAKKNPEKSFLLLIEEINRANVAAVFGDVFQLLDRKSDGTSQYPIAASEDQKNYLESCGINEDEIAIPSNMYIWATMNSADQGVLPMDAAFKRRWDFEYLGIDDGEKNEDGSENTEFTSYILPIPKKNDDGTISYTSESWNKIRHAINDKLKNIYGVNEDKLLGPYFISKSTLDEAKEINFETEADKAAKICSSFKSKVLMYLYEDVVKMNPTELFTKLVFPEDKPLHYSDLCSKFDEIGLKIFDEDFIK